MVETHSDPHPDLAGFVLGGLTPDERVGFEAHLAGCATCRAEVDELQSLPALLDAAATIPDVELPPDLRDRTLAAVAAAEGTVVDFAAGRARREARRSIGRTALLGIVAAAACVLLLVGIIGIRGGDSGGPSTELALAAGTATIEKLPSGWRIELDMELPRRDQGQYYEGFVEGPDGRVSVGTFNEGDDVVLWSGVPLTVYSDFIIVEQPGDHEIMRGRFDL